MADNVNITEAGTTAIAADEVVDGALGTAKVQYVKLMDGSINGTTRVIATSREQPTDPGLVVRQTPCTYETVAANTPSQTLGGAGAIGDYIEGVLIIPDLTSPGGVAIIDNAITINLFTGGTNSLFDLKPFYVQLRIVSVSGPWKVATGSSVRCVAIGRFT
jgi:hypothetical protein